MKPFAARLALTSSTLALLLGACPWAAAVDGVVLIDQNKALAGNVTPGDAPGFPITLSQPGSYRLAGNLTIGDPFVNVIEIRASNVTIDLNGFTIQGPNVCSLAVDGTVTCSLPGSGAGVRAIPTSPIASSAVTVTNGTIRGMSGPAVDLVSAATTGSRIVGLAAVGNAYGIYASTLALVQNNVVHTNQGSGVRVGGASVVLDNNISFNSGFGLLAVTSTASIGYARNVITRNALGSVNGGVAIGPNACDNNQLCQP